MEKEILMFGGNQSEKDNLYGHKSPNFLKFVSNKISFAEKTINTLLVNCMVITK